MTRRESLVGIVLVMIGATCVLVAVLYFQQRYAFTRSPAYAMATKHVEQHRYLRTTLGEPVRTRLGLLFGNFHNARNAVIDIRVSGPHGAGGVTVWLDVTQGQWVVEHVAYQGDGQGTTSWITKKGVQLDKPEPAPEIGNE